ncbi:MAG: peptidase S8, partial [Oscillospiraceae bacterium]
MSTIQDWNDLSFNTDTRWSDKLPVGFDPAELLEFNKNPGLGIRALHEEGITGAGVGIAIIDQALLLDHEQYKEHLMFYERIHCSDDTSQMHGPAVASIAVGKDIGVAPGAKLYYIAETGGHWTDEEFEDDYSVIADCILRILEL